MTAQRPPIHPPRPYARAIPLVIVATLLIAIPPAPAGIRDMVKSAKDKAVQKTGLKPAANPARPGAVPEFDDRVLELTDVRIGQLLKGLKAGAAFTADLPRLVARQQALNEEMMKLNDTHGTAISDYTQKRDAQKDCFKSALEESQKKQFQDMMQQGVANPALLQKMAELGVRFNDAQMKGDTAAVRLITAEMEAMNAYTPADSLAARKKCGAPPPPLPAFLRLEAARSELGAVDERIRDMNLKVREVQLDASDLTGDQFAIAIDRVTLYLAAVKQNETPQGFSPTELQALAANQSALASAIGS